MVRHYDDPTVGAVAGEKKIRKDFTQNSTAGAGEGIYWRYESWLKKMDSDLGSVIGAAGELFSFRNELFEILPADTIIEDFVLSMRIAMRGYRVVYEPNAYAIEAPSISIAEEWKRKVRICAGAFQAFNYLPQLWNPFKYGKLSFQYLAHRFMRWAVVPFLLPIIFLLTGILALQSEFYQALFVLESLGLVIALMGFLILDKIKVPKLLIMSTYVLMMNAAAYAGLIRYWRKNQNVAWEKARRHLL
jgi:cellulose synthase/poly-beta-1,6-N-acetylglucosamine synthase-like glycosyltransferase